MKVRNEILKKCITLAVLALYFFMVCTYILFLPKKNLQAEKASASASAGHLQRDNNAANCIVQLHCSFKSVPENKRKIFIALLKTGAILFVLLLSRVAFNALTSGSVSYLNSLHYGRRYNYLSLRTLRI